MTQRTKKSLTQRSKNKKDKTAILPTTGRSSVEPNVYDGLSKYNSYFNMTSPMIPVQMQKAISFAIITNPDLSQIVKMNIAMINSGFNLVVNLDGKQKQTIIDRLNEKAYNWYQRSAGLDGLVNHYSNQIYHSGAISSEDVLQSDFEGVEQIAIVPAYSIRFKFSDGKYRPYQVVEGIVPTSSTANFMNMVELNENTYTFYALQTQENSPYPIPPFLPAMKPLLIQEEFLQNIRHLSEKFGLLGLNILEVDPLMKNPGESDTKYNERNQKFIDDVAEAVDVNFRKGLLVVPKGQTFKNFSVTSDARGINDLINVIENQVITGAGSHPALLGRPVSYTDAFGRVLYNLNLNQASNVRRLIKRRMEKTIRLDLSLAGFDCSVSMQFNPDPKLDPNTEALADRYKLKNILDKVKSGLISPETAAQEAGYDSWADLELFDNFTKTGMETAELEFHRPSQQFRLRRPVHHIDVKLAKDDHLKALDIVQEFVIKYLKEVLPYFQELPEGLTKWAVEYAKEHEEEILKDSNVFVKELRKYLVANWKSYKDVPLNKELIESVKKRVIDAAIYYREKDISVFGGKVPNVTFKFGDGDRKAAQMVIDTDNIYFSQFLNDKFGTEIRGFLQSFFEKGGAGDRAWTDELEKEFIRKFGAALSGDIKSQLEMIISTSTGTIQINSRMKQLYEAGIKKYRIFELPDCCEICAAYDGKTFEVAAAWKNIENGFVNAESKDAALEWIKSEKNHPKFHPRCRGLLRAVFEDEE